MRVLPQADIRFFLAEKPAAAIHFDAKWDATHRVVTRSAMADAEQVLAERANFGEVDCDSDPELAKSIPILNVPSVAYYRDGKPVGVLIGANQTCDSTWSRSCVETRFGSASVPTVLSVIGIIAS